MSLKKWVGISIVAAGLLSIGFYGRETLAEEQKVYIPNDNFRSLVVDQLENYGEVVENGLPTKSQMELLENVNVYGPSIEGVQYAKNVESVYYETWTEDGYALDLRPIGELTNLKEFHTYAYYLGESNYPNPIDISFMSKLKNIESMSLPLFPLLDMRPLSDLENLEYFQTNSTPIEVSAVPLRKGITQLVMENPVKYSSQFDDVSKEIRYPTNYTYTLEDNLIFIDGIEEATESIEFTITAVSDDHHFRAETTIVVPIIWY